MTPVLRSSAINSLIHPGNALVDRKDNFLARCSVIRTSRKQVLLSHRYVLPMSTSIRLFPQFRIGSALQARLRNHIVASTNTDTAVEETELPAADTDSGEVPEAPSDATEVSEESSPKSDSSTATSPSKRTRSPRKSEMPPIKNEDLIPGATFVGKVRSIQPFGAFVDFGAFTDGLVHVSRLSDSFVKDVSDVVSIGQEVTVRLVEANTETGRISLTMRESDDSSKTQKQKDAPAATTRPPRKPSQKKDEVKNSSKFVKGQELEGTVKNIVRTGAFISLPDGEEGFLPTSEEADDGNFMEGSSLEIGREVKVRVLNISRGKVQLTMKTKETSGEFEFVQGVVHKATNPFLLAFLKNKDISAFLDERQKLTEEKPTDENLLNVDTAANVVESAETTEKKEELESLLSDSPLDVDNTVKSIEEEPESEILPLEVATSVATDVADDAEIISKDENKEDIVADSSQSLDSTSKSVVEEPTDQLLENVLDVEKQEPEIVSPEGTTSAVKDVIEESVTSTSPQDMDNIVKIIVEEQKPVIIPPEGTASTARDIVDNARNEEKSEEEKRADSSQSVDSVSKSLVEEPEASLNVLGVDGITEVLPPVEKIENGENSQLSQPLPEQSTSSESLIDEEGADDEVQDVIVKDEVQIGTPTDVEKPSAVREVEKTAALNLEINGGTAIAGAQVDVASDPGSNGKGAAEVIENRSGITIEADRLPAESPLLTESGISSSPAITAEEVQPDLSNNEEAGDLFEQSSGSPKKEGEAEGIENQSAVEADGLQAESPPAKSEISPSSTTTAEEAGPGLSNSENKGNLNEKNGAPPQKEATTKAAISPALVKQLREETGAGMMDCKRALSEAGGDMVKAQEYLRKKGLASADKKANRTTAEGRIGSYIHDSRIGVLIEVNCETDFVSRGDIFKELVEDIAMQVAACPQVQYLVTDDVPKEIVDKEREIELQKEDLLSKPEQIRSKIVDGRIKKRLEELALLEQPYIKNDKIVVKDLVKQTIATIGENIKVKRFARYNLGEGLEKKSRDFAAEVAAQTTAKPTAPKKEEPAAVEAKEADEKPVQVVASAALVKQLREETGAGMMDCKKALSETGGNLEKAQEYLRKKGLASADKKSGRLAAEGRIGSYIHDARIGVLIEVNCETDFVGRSENFKDLVDNLAMQVVACPQVRYVSTEDIPAEVVSKEKELEMQREDLQSKPENIREKIVEGRVSKSLGELALLGQPFIKNDSILVKDLVKQTVAALGENIKVRRFIRFTLGEEESKPESSAESAGAVNE